MAKKSYNLATEEWVRELITKFQNSRYYDLKTDEKTLVGAINELAEMVRLCLHPTYDISAKMFYGILDPEIVGNIKDFKDIILKDLEVLEILREYFQTGEYCQWYIDLQESDFDFRSECTKDEWLNSPQKKIKEWLENDK